MGAVVRGEGRAAGPDSNAVWATRRGAGTPTTGDTDFTDLHGIGPVNSWLIRGIRVIQVGLPRIDGRWNRGTVNRQNL
jgi:hypothetical protein